MLQLVALPKQRGYTNASAYEQHFFVRNLAKTIAKGQETINCIIFVQLTKVTSSIAYASDKQPQFIAVIIHEVD